MKRTLYLLAAVISIAALLFAWVHSPYGPHRASTGTMPEHFDAEWMRNPYWLDGQAEINVYRSTIVKYGEERATDDVVHIVVSESHRRDLLVKADDWRQPGLIPMLKFNQLVEVQTGIYPYREMATLFFNRADGRFTKMVVSSQEWCGTSFKEIVNFEGRSSYRFNTYWDGQGAGGHAVDFPPDMVPRDALPVQLRGLRFQPGLTLPLTLLPGQVSSRATAPELETAEARVEEKTWLEAPAGRFEVYPVAVAFAAGTDRLWFEADFPHRMVKRETPGGDRFELLRSEKLAYWKLNRLEDESLMD